MVFGVWEGVGGGRLVLKTASPLEQRPPQYYGGAVPQRAILLVAASCKKWNIHIQNIMSNLITSTPNVTNFIAAYEFVALKSARVSFTNTGIANFSNSTANSMYPATQAAMFYDPYNNVAGLGGYPALTLSKLPGAVSCLGRGRIVKYMSARAICKNLGMPYWQPTATSTSNYYVPSGSGIIPIITLGVNTIDGVPNSGNCTAGLLRITGTLIFKNMKQ